MSRRNYTKVYERLLILFMGLSAVGIAILLWNSLDEHPGVVAFSLIAFTISAAALLMSTYQNFATIRQLRMMESMLRTMREAARDVEELAAEDRKLEREIRQDMKLDQEVIAILEEYGVGDSADDRRAVAKRLARLHR